MEYFDSHAHYDDEKFNEDREELIQLLKNENVTKVVSAGYSLEGSLKAIELSKKYPFIYCTVGISPNDIEESYQDDIKQIEQILKDSTVKKVAIEESKLEQIDTKKCNRKNSGRWRNRT